VGGGAEAEEAEEAEGAVAAVEAASAGWRGLAPRRRAAHLAAWRAAIVDDVAKEIGQ